jgi:predicted nuclease of predicted toxin-antitoxin system
LRLKLDENLPRLARTAAASLGHDVDTVVDEGLGGAGDPDVLAAAVSANRFLITLDRGLGDTRRYPLGSHAGIAVLRVDSEDVTTVTAALQNFRAHDDLGDLTGCLVVVRGALIRVRRPDAR